MSEEKRQEYYRYNPAVPSTMVHHEPPRLDPYFNEELLKLAGRDYHGDQRLRIVWAGNQIETKYHRDSNGYTFQYEGMRYPYMKRNVITGYTYINKDGHKVTVPKFEMLPLNTPYSNESHLDELGIMKWVVEMKYTAEELIAMNYYPGELGSKESEEWCVDKKTRQRYRVKPSRTGEYLKCHFIEMPDSLGQGNWGYRDVTEADLIEIRRIWYQAHTETEEEYVERKIDEIEKMLVIEEENKNNKLDNALEDAIIRAEKAPVERVFFLPKLK